MGLSRWLKIVWLMSLRSENVCLWLCLAWLGPAQACAQFRGAERNGRVQGLPSQRLDLEMVWEFPLPSSGVGGVAATDEMVVVSSRTFNDDADLFTILDPTDGAVIYKHQVATQGRLDYGNSPRATPTIGPELVYVLNAFGQLAAIDPTEGQVRWQKHLVDDLGGRLPTWGYCSSPLLYDDKLIVQPGGLAAAIVALDAQTGAVVWKTAGTERSAYASPVLLNASGDSPSVIVGCDQAGLVGWNAATGAELWRIKPETSGEFMVPSPLVWERQLFWLGEVNGLRGYHLPPANSTRPTLWAVNDEVQSDTNSPGVVSGAVVCVDRDLVALDLNDQLKVLDRYQHDSLDGYAAVLTQDERALVCCSDGTFLLLKLQMGKWRKLGECRPRKTSLKSLAHPACVDGKLYVRSERSLICYTLGK